MIDRLMGAFPSEGWAGRLALAFAWQSTLWLAIGLVAARVWQRRAGRAHLLLVLATSAALISPFLTATVRWMQWGILPPPPAMASDSPALEVTPATPNAIQEPVRNTPIDNPSDSTTDESALPDAGKTQPVVDDVPAAPPEAEKIAEQTSQPPVQAWSVRVARYVPLVIAGLWTIATVVLTARLMASLLVGWRITRKAREESNPELVTALHEAARALSLMTVPHVRVSAFARSPMIWCWGRRPVVLVPEYASQDQRILWRSVFCHELAHLVRRDHWSALWAEILVIVLPWQPLGWLCRRRLAFLREQACDDWVLAAGGTATDYAESLLQFAPQASPSHALAAVSSAAMLKKRLEHVLSDLPIVPKVGGRWVAAANLTALLAMSGIALAQQGPRKVESDEKGPSPSSRPDSKAVVEPVAGRVGSPRSLSLGGHVVDDKGTPIIGAAVSAIAGSRANVLGGTLEDRQKILGEATTDRAGAFVIRISGVSAKSHSSPVLIAVSDGHAIAAQPFDLDKDNLDSTFHLGKERIVRGRFVDLQGQPAAGVSAHVARIGLAPMTRLPGTDDLDGNPLAGAWPKKLISDAQGRFAIRGIGADQKVYLEIDGDDRYAQQFLPLNAAGRDRTKAGVESAAVRPSSEVVVPLSPATVVEGVIRFADTKQPAPKARLTVYAQQDPPFGGLVGIPGQADDQGRFRVIPFPGINFEVTAYPPQGTPYLIRQSASKVKPGTARAEINVELPRGVLVRGRILETRTNQPVANASIQYIPATKTQARASNGVVTGWPGIAISDSSGEFEISVLPGPGHLLVHGPTADYTYEEIGDRQLSNGRPGGRRNYAHAIVSIDPPSNSAPRIDLAIKLTFVPPVSGRLLTPDGQPVEEALMISRLQINPTSPTWRSVTNEVFRGGTFTLTGCSPGVAYPVYFLDPKHQLGATKWIESNSVTREPVVVSLAACGAAKARFVDSQGKPIAELEPSLHLIVTPGAFPFNIPPTERRLAADFDFASNIDRKNQTPSPKSDSDGVATFRVLIPGATYALLGAKNRELASLKQFTAEAGRTLDLGDIVADPPRGR